MYCTQVLTVGKGNFDPITTNVDAKPCFKIVKCYHVLLPDFDLCKEIIGSAEHSISSYMHMVSDLHQVASAIQAADKSVL